MRAGKIVDLYANEYITLAEANDLFEKYGHNVRLNPHKNIITEAEKAATVVDTKTGIYKGFALVDVQVGGLEKIRIVDGKTEYNLGFDTICFMGGHKFNIINGEKLVFVE